MSTAFPNEPTGATTRFDHAFNNLSGLTDVYASTEIVTDATAPLSPSNVGRHHLNPGATQGGGQVHAYLPSAYTDMFVGMWWKLNSGFQGRRVADKMFFMRGPDRNGFFGLLGGPNKGGGPFYLSFGHNTGALDNSHTMAGDLGLIGYPNVGPATVTPGVWFKIEAYIKASTTSTSRDGIVRWWVNGTLAGNYTNVNYGPGGLNEWVWSETWDGSGDMGTSNTVRWEHHVDHLYISTGGTGSGGSGGGGGGGGGGTPQILPAPTGLYPNGVTLPYGPTTFQWNAVPGAVEYKLRVHVGGMPYDPPTPPNYLAVEDLSATSRQLTTSPSSTYDWWIHSENSVGDFGPSNGASFSTTASPEPPPPNPDPPPDPPPPPPVEPPVDPPPPVVIPPVDPTDPTTLPPDQLPQPQVLGTATVIVTVKDLQNPIKKEFFFYG